MNYTWSKFNRDCDKMLHVIPNIELFNSIAGIAFGGLPLLTCLKNTLDLPTRVIFASSYVGRFRDRLEIKLGDLDKLIPPALIVDDVVDTGYTMKAVSSYLNRKKIEHITFTLFYKENKIFKPDYFLHKANKWINFPWEDSC